MYACGLLVVCSCGLVKNVALSLPRFPPWLALAQKTNLSPTNPAQKKKEKAAQHMGEVENGTLEGNGEMELKRGESPFDLPPCKWVLLLISGKMVIKPDFRHVTPRFGKMLGNLMGHNYSIRSCRSSIQKWFGRKGRGKKNAMQKHPRAFIYNNKYAFSKPGMENPGILWNLKVWAFEHQGFDVSCTDNLEACYMSCSKCAVHPLCHTELGRGKCHHAWGLICAPSPMSWLSF